MSQTNLDFFILVARNKVLKQILIFDVFKEKEEFLKSTLFAGVANQYLGSLGGHGLSFGTTLKALRIAIRNVGLFNILRYNRPIFLKMVMKTLLVTVLPAKYYEKVKSKTKARVNKKLLSSVQKS